MDQQDVAAQQAVETDTTQTNSPQVEAPITGEQTMQEEEVSNTPVVEESDMPVSTEEQRRAFQEMRLENKRLKEEMEARQTGESAFAPFRAVSPQVPSNPVTPQQFTDPVTGETNWQAFNYAQQQREQQILQQARFEAQSTVQEQLDEERARTKFPELMNNPQTEKLIAAQWFYEKAQGNNVSISQIAGEFARNFKQAVSKAEKVGAERVLTEVSEKEKAGLTASSQSGNQAQKASSQENAEYESTATRRGNQDAITARISRIPWANK